ncbi:MAG: family 78 glycoside hydrolase catalytic domain, partial [Mycobacterium sp.]
MTLAPVDLRIDTRTDPLGIDGDHPRLTWRHPVGGARPGGYAVQVSTDPGFGRLVWDTGRLDDDQSLGVDYAGADLDSRRRYWWRVGAWEDAGEGAAWSAPSTFETAILDPSWWRAQWITGPAPRNKNDHRALYLQTAVDLSAPVVRGRAYVSALGWYRFTVNDVDLTGPALVPRWTPFDDYVEYQVYDVTEAFRVGSNVAALAIGDGRFRGRLGLLNQRAVYGDRLAGLAQLELELADGTSVSLVTDRSWQAGGGQIITADPKFGERVDLRVAHTEWCTAETLPTHRSLIAEQVAQVREVGRLAARSVRRTPTGTQIVDFGQNFAGVTRIRLTGATGTTVGLTHSEVTGPDGNLDGLRYQRDEVVLAGENTWWQPWFTIHGFRYVEVDGLTADLDPADVEGIVLSSDLPAAGDFDCSDPRLNQLRRNVEWSLRSNFVDTPTDCPTRERSGWTGDIQVFASTASTFVDIQAYLRRYLRNLATEQHPDGRIPVFIPSETSRASPRGTRLMRFPSGSVGWGDAAVLLPWTLYTHYGDRDILEQQYSSMAAWVDQLALRARHKRSPGRRIRRHSRAEVEPFLLDTGFHFGEWLRPGTSLLGTLLDSRRHRSVVATAYLEHSARTLATICGVLGRTAEAARYRDLADQTRHAWRTVFLHDDGRIGTDRQDDYVRALAFDLLDEDERAAAVHRLVTLIDEAGGHLGTGFLSTPMLLPVLVDGGRPDVAWKLLLQDSTPSWLHQITQGATTMWETWEGYDDKGRANSSHNHYAFGAVAGFLTERVAGLRPAAPGYRVIDIAPLVGGGLTHARASVRTPLGVASSSWTRAEQT